MTGLVPQLANPAFRFRVQQGEKLRAVGDLKRSQAHWAAAVQTPADVPTWGHFAAVFWQFQGEGIPECLVMAKADHREAYKQMPVCEERKKMAVVAFRGRGSGTMGSFISQTWLFGPTDAALQYNTVSRVVARVAVR